MPQTYEALRKKFWKGNDTGELEAERILKESGCEIINGMITAPLNYNLEKHTKGDQIDAIEYLVEEWDYGYSVVGNGEE